MSTGMSAGSKRDSRIPSPAKRFPWFGTMRRPTRLQRKRQLASRLLDADPVYISRSAFELNRINEWAMQAWRDAREPRLKPLDAVITDPPYYDAINYADLSDFFYVWLKRSVGFLYPDLMLRFR